MELEVAIGREGLRCLVFAMFVICLCVSLSILSSTLDRNGEQPHLLPGVVSSGADPSHARRPCLASLSKDASQDEGLPLLPCCLWPKPFRLLFSASRRQTLLSLPQCYPHSSQWGCVEACPSPSLACLHLCCLPPVLLGCLSVKTR